MPRGRIISLNGKIDTSAIRENRYPIILTAVSCVGILLGVLTLKYVSDGRLDSLLEMVIGFNSAGSSKTFTELFCTSLVASLGCLMLCFFSGLCLLGKPIILVMLFLKGAGTGLVCAYLYNLYALDGLEYCSLMLNPSCALLFAALIIAANESMHTVNDLTACTIKMQTDVNISLRVYLIRYIVPLVMCLLSSALSALTGVMFSDLFTM